MADRTAPGGAQYWTAALLWESCRRHPRPEVVRQALDRGADPDLALDAAARHRLTGLLWRSLSAAGVSELLGDRRQWLADVAEVHRLEAVLLLPAAVRSAVTPLTDAGYEPVVMKGPAVAARYPAPGLRRMGDIDILLPRADHAGAVRVLGDAGWRVARPSARDHYDTVLTHPEVPALALELHYGLEAWYERVTRLDPQELWESRVTIDCMGTKAFGLPLPQELVVLAAHAGKPFHGFEELIWIADLAMITGDAAEHGRPVDWDQVVSLAERGRCTTVVSCALALARRAGVEVPDALLPLPTRGWRAAALEPLVGITWPLVHDDISTFHLRFALADSFGRRLALLAGSGHGAGLEGHLRYSIGAPLHAARTLVRLRRRRNTTVGRPGKGPAGPSGARSQAADFPGPQVSGVQ